MFLNINTDSMIGSMLAQKLFLKGKFLSNDPHSMKYVNICNITNLFVDPITRLPELVFT